MREVQCGLGRFVLTEDDVVHQYDHEGIVVGITNASDVPDLRKWIIEKAPKVPTGRPNGYVMTKKEQREPRFR
jgi:hypothetical protein